MNFYQSAALSFCIVIPAIIALIRFTKINEGYYDLPNTFLFPHLGSAAIEARNQMGFEALDNIDAALAGKDMPFKLT